MDEITMLREAFGPEELPTDGARERARTALLGRGRPRRHRSPWPLRVGLSAAVAAAVAGVAVVSGLGTPDTPGNHGAALGHGATGGPAGATGGPAALPYTHPVNAVQYLENAAWTADAKTWTNPRPDQFMYRESKVLHNDKALEAKAPNGPLVPGRSHVVLEQRWNRIDARVMAHMDNGKLVVDYQNATAGSWAQVPYAELVDLTTPDKVVAWQNGPHPVADATLEALLSQYVLPPKVQAAIFRTIARGDGVRLDPDTANLDGRPAVGLGLTIEGYLSRELLFDKATYTLIGERLVAIADHTNVGDDGTSYTHKGDVFRQATYTASVIVDKAGATS